MAQLGIIKKGNTKIAPATTSAAVVDINRTRTLDASLQELVEAQALGFPAFSESTAYAVGDKVFYNRRIYRFTAAHAAGAWNAAQVEEVSMQDSIREIDDRKANIDGYYGSLTVGTAENLVGRGTVEANYAGVRTTAGTADIGSGSATITKVMGNSVKWNQINKYYVHRDYLTPTTSTAYLTPSQGFQKVIVTGHKYYSHYKMSAKDITGSARLYPYGMFPVTPSTLLIVINENREQAEYKVVGNAVGSTGYFLREFSNFTGNDCLIFVVLIDLTEIFGEGNEPATVEEFEAWLAANVGLRDYYPYDEGSIINNSATAITTRGFNLYDHATGKAYLPGKYSDYPQEYEICGTFTSISYTDINGNTYVPELTDGKFFNVDAPGELTVVGGNNTDTLVHMVWSGWRNEGEPDYAFEPYWKNTLQLNLKTLTGKLNGEGESVVVFPNGMCKIGEVQDEIIGGVTAIKRIGVVDLGTLNWSYQSSDYRFITSDVKNIKGGTLNLLNLQYKVTTYGQVRAGDKRIGVHSSMYIAVRDDDYSGYTSSFKPAVSGVLLYYELATPEVYILDNEIPTNYRVDDFGTEEVESNDVVNAAIRYDVQYAMNAADTLRRLPQNYVSATQVQTFSDAQKAQARQNIDVEAVLATINREQVLVEAVAYLQAQIDGLRESMANMGNMKAETINTAEIPAVCDNPLITLAAGAPVVAPRVAGALYIDTTNNNIYYAKSVTSNSTGWVKLV